MDECFTKYVDQYNTMLQTTGVAKTSALNKTVALSYAKQIQVLLQEITDYGTLKKIYKN